MSLIFYIMNVIELKRVYERDMDMLIMEEFFSDKAFARLFLDKVDLDDNYSIDSIYHSLSDENGESDITIILQYSDKKIAILVEDKITAPTMPSQSERYIKRANEGKKHAAYDSYHIFLVAPSAYISAHSNDINANYPNKVAYEELAEFFKHKDSTRALFKYSVISNALKEKEHHYVVNENIRVTSFWSALRTMCKEQYPHLEMLGNDTPKGASAAWPEFRTSCGKIKVVYKSTKGYVDLEFPGYGDRVADLESKIQNHIKPPIFIHQSGKSASLRLADDRWQINFSDDFNQHKIVIYEVLDAVSEMCLLASKINYSDLY